jgi:hypothetical protein
MWKIESVMNHKLAIVNSNIHTYEFNIKQLEIRLGKITDMVNEMELRDELLAEKVK